MAAPGCHVGAGARREAAGRGEGPGGEGGGGRRRRRRRREGGRRKRRRGSGGARGRGAAVRVPPRPRALRRRLPGAAALPAVRARPPHRAAPRAAAGAGGVRLGGGSVPVPVPGGAALRFPRPDGDRAGCRHRHRRHPRGLAGRGRHHHGPTGGIRTNPGKHPAELPAGGSGSAAGASAGLGPGRRLLPWGVRGGFGVGHRVPPPSFPHLLGTLRHLCGPRSLALLCAKMRGDGGARRFFRQMLPPYFRIQLLRREPEEEIEIYRLTRRGGGTLEEEGEAPPDLGVAQGGAVPTLGVP
ncbi:unnamed protein product [Bubo scandiacus]